MGAGPDEEFTDGAIGMARVRADPLGRLAAASAWLRVRGSSGRGTNVPIVRSSEEGPTSADHIRSRRVERRWLCFREELYIDLEGRRSARSRATSILEMDRLFY